MARIDAGQGFGNAIAEPAALSRTPLPAAAFAGVTEPAVQQARALNQAADVVERDQQAQQEQAVRADMARIARAQREADARMAAERQAKEAAERATAQTRMLVLTDTLTDTLGEVSRGVAEGAIPKDEAPTRWTERTKELIEAGIEQVPEAHRPHVRMTLEATAQRYASRVGDAVRQRNQSDTAAAIESTLEHAQRLATTDPAGARALVDSTLANMGPGAGWNPQQIGKIRQRWAEQTAYTNAFTAVNQAKGSNQQLTAVEKALNADPSIDPQRKAGLLAQIEGFRANNEARALRQAQQAEIAAARRQRESDSAFQVLSTWVMSGKMPDEAANAGLISRLTPQQAQAYRAMAAEIPARTALAMQPLSVMQQRLDELIAIRNTRGTSQALEQEIKRVTDVRAEALKDYAADPLRAAQERNLLETPLQPLNLSSIDTAAAGLATRVQQAQTVQSRTGRPVSPLVPEEAERVGSMLSALSPTDRAARIAQLATVLPPAQMTALAAQMDGKNRTLYLEMALGATKTASGRTASEWVSRGAQAVKDKAIKEDNAAMTGLRSQIAASLPPSLPPKWREDVIDAARLIYLGQQSTPGFSPSAAGAAQVALGGSIIEHNGEKIPTAGAMDEDEFRRRLTTGAPAQVQRQAPGGQVVIGGRAVPVAEFLPSLPDAKLIPVGPGRYAIDAGGVAVTDTNRRPILVEVR